MIEHISDRDEEDVYRRQLKSNSHGSVDKQYNTLFEEFFVEYCKLKKSNASFDEIQRWARGKAQSFNREESVKGMFTGAIILDRMENLYKLREGNI